MLQKVTNGTTVGIVGQVCVQRPEPPVPAPPQPSATKPVPQPPSHFFQVPAAEIAIYKAKNILVEISDGNCVMVTDYYQAGTSEVLLADQRANPQREVTPVDCPGG